MLPSSEEALEAAVRRRGEADPIALPEIPLTTLGEAVSPEYHPLAAAEVLAKILQPVQQHEPLPEISGL